MSHHNQSAFRILEFSPLINKQDESTNSRQTKYSITSVSDGNGNGQSIFNAEMLSNNSRNIYISHISRRVCITHTNKYMTMFTELSEFSFVRCVCVWVFLLFFCFCLFIFVNLFLWTLLLMPNVLSRVCAFSFACVACVYSTCSCSNSQPCTCFIKWINFVVAVAVVVFIAVW